MLVHFINMKSNGDLREASPTKEGNENAAVATESTK